MLLVVKILFLQSVKGGFQSSLIYSLVLLPYSFSLTIIPFVSVVSLGSLLSLFFPFSKTLILYIQKETEEESNLVESYEGLDEEEQRQRVQSFFVRMGF